MSNLDSPQAKLSAADTEVTLQYEQREEGVRAEAYQMACSLALVFMLAGTTLDWAVVPELVPLFFLIRIASAVVLAVVLILLKQKPRGSMLRVLGHMVAFLPMVAILFMIWVAGERADTYYAGLNLVLIGASMLLRWPTRDSIVSAALCMGSYALIGWLTLSALPDGVRIWYNNCYFLGVTAVFSCVGTHLYNKLRFSEFQLVREIQKKSTEITESHAKLQALDEAKTRFFANVSHELRTPLTLILGPLEQLRATPTISRDAQSSSLLVMLEENGLRLLRLIDNLLDLVRNDGGNTPLHAARIPTEAFVSSIASSLAATARTKSIQLDCKIDVGSEPDCWLERNRLEKILLNLGMNAVKFTPRGGRIIMGAEVVGERVLFSVSDTGPGIKTSDMSLIFEPFWQADMSARRKHGGVGIGLALCKQLTESMGGKISLQTEEGKGTTFLVDLPLRLDRLKAEAAAELGAVVEEGEYDPVEELHVRAQLTGLNEDESNAEEKVALFSTIQLDGVNRARILIADDEQGLRRYLATVLSQHETIEAKDGKEAWELARQHSPDLILLDLMMPELDGLEVARKLKENMGTSRIPIVLITANNEEAPKLEALRAGVSDFVTKPFSTVELQARLGNLLKQKRFEKDLALRKTELEAAHRELQENEARLVHAESLSALGRMSAGLIHEVNNPLNFASSALHILKRYTPSLEERKREEYVDTLADLDEGLTRVIKIVSDLRSFTTGAKQPFRELDLSKALESARRLVSDDLGSAQLLWNVQDGLQVWGSENQLVQVFVNILSNAGSFVQAANKRGDVPTVTVTAQSSSGGTIVVSVHDNGSGIPPADLGRVFEPFFTSRDVGAGMGLGLSICHQICQSHSASLEAHSELGAWTEFTLCFPPLSYFKRGSNS